MDKFKEALIKLAHSNPSLFPNDATRLIEQRFSQFFPDLQIPNHPPYAAMIHKAIRELKEKGGSSEESISEHIKRENVNLPWAHTTLLKHHLEKLCDRKEIRMTHKQSYLIGGADSDPISSRSDKQLKRKQNSESGKKSSKQRKKQKSGPDSESCKTSNRKQKKYKKKKECQLDLQETNKQIVEVVQEKVFQEQDLVLQPLDDGADEQENIIHNGLCEPQYLENENGTFEEGISLIDISVQGMEEGGVPANPEEQNQSEIGKDKNLGEKVSMSTRIDDTGNETQSVELANGKDQIDTNGTTKKGKLKRKKRLKSETRNSKRGKKQEINEDTQLQTSSETSLKQHNNVTEGDSNEQNQIIEVNMTEIPVQYENVVEESVDGVEEDVEKDGETIQESHPDNSGQIQMEKSSDPYPILLKNKHPGRRFLTRSQIKTISKKDASVRPEIMDSSNHANVPNDEHSPEEKQPVIETKQLSSAVSTQMNGQRAKLRSSQKNTDHLETKQKSRSPSLETPLKEILNPKCIKKLSPEFPDLNESETEVQESGSSQQDQQPDELEAKPKYKGRGRRPKNKGRDISKKCLQSAKKCKVLSKHPKPKRDEDKSTAFIQKVKHSHVKKGKQKDQSEQQPNEEDEAKDNGHGRHKMMRRSSRKEKDSNS